MPEPPMPEPPKREPQKAEQPKPSKKQHPQPEASKGTWERAREETRRKEEERKAKEAERKAKEAEQRKKEEVARRLKELREKETRERARREREAKEKQEQEVRERVRREQELREKLEQEAREKIRREIEAKEKQEREAREREQREREQRERESREREQREKEQREREIRERAQREKEIRDNRLREARERELRERLEREKILRERLQKEAKEREAARLREAQAAKEAQVAKEAQAAKEAQEAKEREETTRKSTYVFSSVGERTSLWPNGRPPSQPASPVKPSPPPSSAPSSAKRPPPPTARTTDGHDDDASSYRPYAQSRGHARRRSGETVFTESSYAPSHSTTRTSPPPSMRMPYTTKDPDKIVIKGVFGFLNQFSKTPASQLISGIGSVTDGLILRITTEGLFIDDDVRAVPQREWDIKAWTLKLMEVWCPPHCVAEPTTASPKAPPKAGNRFRTTPRGQPKTLTGSDADAYLIELLQSCKNECRLGPHGGRDDASSYADGSAQTGELKHRGLHVLRATIRDQEGKRFIFVIGEEEGWKVAAGLQRLRRGTQVRQLGVQGMGPMEAKNTLEMLGW